MNKTARSILKKYGWHNPDLGDEYGETLVQAMEEYAQQFSAPIPQVAGLANTGKLVKALEQVVALSKSELDKKFFGCVMADCIAALDEYYKNDQVFTREEVREIIADAFINIRDGSWKGMHDADHYLNTNYPAPGK